MDVPADASPIPVCRNGPALGQALSHSLSSFCALPFPKSGQKFVIGKIRINSSLSNENGDLAVILAQRSISCSDGFRSAQVPAVTGKLFQNIFPVMLRELLHVFPLYLLTTSLIWGQHCPLA